VTGHLRRSLVLCAAGAAAFGVAAVVVGTGGGAPARSTAGGATAGAWAAGHGVGSGALAPPGAGAVPRAAAAGTAPAGAASSGSDGGASAATGLGVGSGGGGRRGITVVGPGLPAAPPGFASQVVGVYGGIYAVQQVITAGSPPTAAAAPTLPAPSAFAQDVAHLSSAELAELYRATRQHPEWASVVANEHQLAVQVPTRPLVPANPVAALTDPTRALLHGAAANLGAVDAHEFPPPSATGSFPPAPAPYQSSSPVAPYQPIACPAPAPGGPPNEPGDTAIFTQQLTVDIATEVAADVPETILVSILGEGTSVPNAAKYVANAIAQAAQLVLDSFTFMQSVANDCDTTNRDGVMANIDNTTVNTFALLSAMEGTLDSVQSGVDTVGSDLTTLQQTLDDQVTIMIEQDLAEPGGSVPNIALELPASAGGYLDSVPTGVQSVVHQAVTNLQSAGEPVDAMAVRDLAAGDAALAAGQYAVAYADFHQAYLQAVG
jgi:hypothetical protein